MVPRFLFSLACGTVLLLAALAYAGRVPCPGSVRATCQPKDVNVHPISFRGGTPAVISIQGDGRTDLALVVLDGAGRIVGQSVGKSPSFSWTPHATSQHKVKVVNLTNVYVHYILRTN